MSKNIRMTLKKQPVSIEVSITYATLEERLIYENAESPIGDPSDLYDQAIEFLADFYGTTEADITRRIHSNR